MKNKAKPLPTSLSPQLAAVLTDFYEINDLDADYQTITNPQTKSRLFNLGYLARGRVLVGGGERYHISQFGLQMLDAHLLKSFTA